MMVRPKTAIPYKLYVSENDYSYFYETTIKEFKEQLLAIPLGDTLKGPILVDTRRLYGHIEFTRAIDYGWIVTLRKDFEGIANLFMSYENRQIFLKTVGLDQSGKVVQTILNGSMMDRIREKGGVLIEVKILEDHITERCQTANQISRMYKEQLLSELERMFNSGLFADFTLIVLGEKVQAHKNILAASSKYFAALFKSEMIESLTDCLVVNDSKPSTIRATLQYIYTGQVTKPDFRRLGLENYEDVDFYSDLLIAADKYQLDDLKSFCEGLLCDLVNEKSLDNLVLLTSRLNLDKLRKSIAKFALGPITRNIASCRNTRNIEEDDEDREDEQHREEREDQEGQEDQEDQEG